MVTKLTPSPQWVPTQALRTLGVRDGELKTARLCRGALSLKSRPAPNLTLNTQLAKKQALEMKPNLHHLKGCRGQIIHLGTKESGRKKQPSLLGRL